MEEFGALALIWLIHVAIAGSLTAPIVFLSRRRVCWQWWEIAAFVLPFGVWATLMALDSSGKSLSNLAEPFYFGLSIPFAAIIRVAIGNRPRNSAITATLILAICGIAAATYFTVPPLPE